jgi:hypothetical protein
MHSGRLATNSLTHEEMDFNQLKRRQMTKGDMKKGDMPLHNASGKRSSGDNEP